MKITVLGAGTCIPSVGYSPAGYVLTGHSSTVLMDPGPGSIARMSINGLDYRHVNLVLVSHLHPDHTLDLMTLIQALGSTPGWWRTEALTLLGCHGLTDFVGTLLRVYPDIGPETFALKMLEFDRDPVDIGEWHLTSARTGHTPESLATRIESGGRSVVYTGDVADPGAIVDICRGVDTLLCECSFPDGLGVPDHLTPGQVGQLARAASVGRVVLTHFYPSATKADLVSEVKKAFSGSVTMAHDGMVVEL